MPEDISLFEERYSKIYRFKKPIDAKQLEKLFKKLKLPFKKQTIKALAEGITKFTNGEYSIREVYNKIKENFEEIEATINDIVEIYDFLEYNDIVEYVGSKEIMVPKKPKEKEEAQPVKALEIPSFIAPEIPSPTEISYGPLSMETIETVSNKVEALKQAVLEIRTDMETLKNKFESLFEELEKEATPSVPEIKITKEKELLEEAIKRGSKKLFEKLFQINEYIEAALTSTIEGVPLVYLSRYKAETITEGVLATALAVVLTKSLELPKDLNKGRVYDVTIYTTNNIIVLKPFMDEYFIALLVRKNALLGLVLRDVDWLLKELQKIIKEVIGSVGVGL